MRKEWQGSAKLQRRKSGKPNPPTNGAKRRHRGKSRQNQVWLPGALRQRVKAEARKLGLSPREYLNMAISISESFTQALPKDSIDMKSMAKIVDSPIWSLLIQSIGPTISGFLDQDEDETKETSQQPQTPQQRIQPGQRQGAPMAEGAPWPQPPHTQPQARNLPPHGSPQAARQAMNRPPYPPFPFL